MGLIIRDTNTTPRERFWPFPAVDGSELRSNSWMNLLREVQQHYTTNGRTPPTVEEITKYVCDEVTVPCFEGNVPYKNRFTDPPTFLQRGKPSPDWGGLNFLKLMAKEGDKGMGDIVQRVIGPIGGDAFKKWYKRIFGADCGCKERQEDWNASYPL